MSEDRKFWPQAGMDAKVAMLSDFEFRVWHQYIVSANDLGVMPLSAALLQGANRALAERPIKLVKKSLDTVVSVELVLVFAFDGAAFCWSRKWQDWQDIKWPRRSTLPFPSNLHLASPKTVGLFELYCSKHGVEMPDLSASALNNSERTSKDFPSRAGARVGHARNPHPDPSPNTTPQPPEESARETVATPMRPTRGRPVMSGHIGCYFAPAACARGVCLPSWLGREWLQQFADPVEGEAAIAKVVADALDKLPAGPVADEPKVFWRSVWRHRHAAPRRPAAGAVHDMSWADECQALHGGECPSRFQHGLKMGHAS